MSETVLDIEDKVFEIIQEYVNGKRPFNISNAVPVILSRFSKDSVNINKNGIKKILQKLIKKKKIVKGSVLTKENVLQNLNRKAIFEIIQNALGIIFNKIVKESGLSNYVVFWHTELLKDFDYIRVAEIEGKKIYYDSQVNNSEVRRGYIKSKKKSQQILEYLTTHDIGVSKTQIAQDLNMHNRTASKYLRLLQEIALIEKEKIDNTYLYFLTNKTK